MPNFLSCLRKKKHCCAFLTIMSTWEVQDRLYPSHYSGGELVDDVRSEVGNTVVAPDPAASPEQRALVPWNAMSSKPFSSAGRGLQQYMGKQPWSIVQTASTSQQSVGEADSQYTAIYLVAAEC
eukprot:g31146.t1